ncbi:MAG: hypothetical protein VB962_05210 [Pseudohongiellaceae bacterium]|jgi:hypothetical protein|tara:strand:- start:3098 stop:3922 length:825 start_codon:yes stop_codon:yes gene_type:complete
MVSRLQAAAITSILSVVTTLFVANSAMAQTTSSYSAPRAWDGNPDINGIWQAIGTAHWNIQDHAASAGLPELGALGAVPPGQGIVVGDEIPYQAWALEKRQENWDNRQRTDPEAKCYLPGVPRATYLPYPFQILQGTNKIMVVYGYAAANRTIHMDKENPETAPLDTWMGRSHGYWDGDTLVVDAQGFNGEAWFDRAGNFASSSLKVTERYTPIGPNAMMYEATLEDPTVFTRPWQISMPLYRRLEANAQVIEYKCVEFSEEMLYGHLYKKNSE